MNVLAELAAVLDDLDCVEVLNLDGGGSSALVFGERRNLPVATRKGARSHWSWPW